MKKALLASGAVLVLLVLTLAALFLPIFTGNKAPSDGETLVGGATAVLDGYVLAFMLPTGEGTLALIDCGNDDEGIALMRALKAKKIEPTAVKAIFLTHGHPDHIAGCHLFPKAEVYAFPGDVKIASGEERAKGPLPSKLDLPKHKAIKVTRTLTDGETVTVGTLTVKAYAVPGHTSGSGVYLANSVLFMGDVVNGRSDGKTLKNAPWLFSDDTAQSQASVAKLYQRLKAENADVKTLAPAHSGTIPGLDALLTAS